MPAHEIDPEILHRLVDGELDSASVARLVDVARDNPDHWRTIAMSFVEEQQFRQSFESFDRQSATKPAVVTPAATPLTDSGFSALRLLATAAGLAAALTIGFILGGDANSPRPGEAQTNSIVSNPPERAPESPLTTADFEPEYRMELVNVDGEPVGSQVDLYRMEDLQKLTGNSAGDPFTFKQVIPESGITDVARDRLSRSGYFLDEDTGYVSGQLEDGRTFVVPVRSIRLNTSH